MIWLLKWGLAQLPVSGGTFTGWSVCAAICQIVEKGIGTKSQQALKLQQEQNKLVRKERSKKEREEESDRMFEMKQQKKKEKHRGH